MKLTYRGYKTGDNKVYFDISYLLDVYNLTYRCEADKKLLINYFNTPQIFFNSRAEALYFLKCFDVFNNSVLPSFIYHNSIYDYKGFTVVFLPATKTWFVSEYNRKCKKSDLK